MATYTAVYLHAAGLKPRQQEELTGDNLQDVVSLAHTRCPRGYYLRRVQADGRTVWDDTHGYFR